MNITVLLDYIRSKWNRQRPQFTKLRMAFLQLNGCKLHVISAGTVCKPRKFLGHCLTITRNLGQEGGRVCYFIQNGVAFLLEIEWEVFQI